MFNMSMRRSPAVRLLPILGAALPALWLTGCDTRPLPWAHSDREAALAAANRPAPGAAATTGATASTATGAATAATGAAIAAPAGVAAPGLPLATVSTTPPTSSLSTGISTAGGAAGPDAAPHPVTPNSPEEIERKRAEWAEHLRQTEQNDRDMENWRRTRTAGEAKPLPRVGATVRDSSELASENARRTVLAWHRGYWERSSAVRTALSRLGTAMKAAPADQEQTHQACSDLHDAIDNLTGDPQTLAAPQSDIARPLANAYSEMKAAANACLAGHSDEIARHIGSASQAMAQAGAALRPFNLRP